MTRAAREQQLLDVAEELFLANGYERTSIEDIANTPIRINGGYFIFRREIFEYIGAGEELVNEPFQRLVRQRQLAAYEYDGFWRSMDTFKDRTQLEEIYSRGHAPWQVWNGEAAAPATYAAVGA